MKIRQRNIRLCSSETRAKSLVTASSAKRPLTGPFFFFNTLSISGCPRGNATRNQINGNNGLGSQYIQVGCEIRRSDSLTQGIIEAGPRYQMKNGPPCGGHFHLEMSKF